MSATTLHRAIPRADDVLEIHGTDANGNKIVAYGWVSAITNHYDATAYGDKFGNVTLDPTAKPRKMTDAEIRAYCQSLLDATTPAPSAPNPNVQPITFA